MEPAVVRTFVELAKRHAGVALLVCLGFVLLPDSWLPEYLSAWRQKHDGWLVPALLVAATFCLPGVLAVVRRDVNRLMRWWGLAGLIRSLPPDEKEVLREFMDAGRRSMPQALSSGAVAALAQRGLLFRATTVSIPEWVPVFEFTLADDVWRLLLRKPHLLD